MYSFSQFITEIFDKPPKVEYLPSKTKSLYSGNQYHEYNIHHNEGPPAVMSIVHEPDTKEAGTVFMTHSKYLGGNTTDRNDLGPSQARKIFAGVHDVIKQHIKSGRIGDMKNISFVSSKYDDSRASLYKTMIKKYGGEHFESMEGHHYSIPVANIKKHLGMES